MILVDTSIWIDHIRTPNNRLISLLEAELVSVHPMVVGELACGNLADRVTTIYLLGLLPQVTVATDNEVLFFIDRHRIAGKGVGYLDMHLLAAAALGGLKIWTRDRRLDEVAKSLGLNARQGTR
ncbi:MAG: PIN domain-containing protein [Terracidiphilus sp.]|jgi:predicted nucleic acid-binding protein